jgi:hypothetical protein
MHVWYLDESYFHAGIYSSDGYELKSKTVFIDTNGEIITEIDSKYAVGALSEGLINVKCQQENKWGYINTSGEVIVPFVYDQAEAFFNGLAVVGVRSGRNMKYGLIEKTGEEIALTEYDQIFHYRAGYTSNIGDLILVQKNVPRSEGRGTTRQQFGLIDKNGDEIIPVIYDNQISFEHGLARVEKDGRHGIIDKTGSFVIDLIYENVFVISERIIAARKDEQWGLINIKGDVILDFEYEWIFRNYTGANNKLICVRKDGVWGIIEIRK